MLSQITKGRLASFVSFKRFFTAAPEPENLSPDDIIYRAADKIIEERIRPVIKSDGGDVSLDDVKDGVLIVSFQGACQGCHSKHSTMFHGILGLIQDEVPGVKGIRERLDFEDL